MSGTADQGHSYKSVLKFCIIICLAPVIFGFDYGGTTGFLAMPSFVRDFGYYNSKTSKYYISASNQTLLSGTPLALACVAAWISGPLGNRFGRCWGLAAAAITSIVGPVVQTAATKWFEMVLGRCIAGMGIGFAINFAVAYWSEATPADLRGTVVVLYQGVTNVAQFIAQCVNQGTYRYDNRWSYRVPLLMELVAPTLLLGFLVWMPDTPRWYMSRGKAEKAKTALKRLRGPTYTEEEINTELQDIAIFLENEKALERSNTLVECFRGVNRRRTLICMGMSFSQAWSGIAFISSYGTYFYQISGVDDPFMVTVATGICGMAGSAASIPLIKYVGRRKIMLAGSLVCGLSMFIIAIVAVAAPNSTAAGKCLAAFVSIYIFAYGASWGPVNGVIIGETPCTRLRSPTIALATSVGWSSDVLIVCGMPYLISPDHLNLGAKVGFIFGACEVLILLWIYFTLPEMKDRTLEEIDEMFMNKIPTLNFKTYKTTGFVRGVQESAAEDGEKAEVIHIKA